MLRSTATVLILALGVAAFGAALFKHLSYPLLWQDEGETVMFGERVLEYGYPKVHGRRNVLNEFGPHFALGVDERSDAYIGKTWVDFYYAVPGILWARKVADPHAKTLRLRLPFAAAGALGTALMLWAVWPAWRGARNRALGFAAAYWWLAATSVSFVLHLREVRYYPLLLLVVALILAVHLRYAVFGKLGFRSYAISQTVLLLCLFHVFHLAWFSVWALLVVERLHAAWADPGPVADRARRVARDLVPQALALLAVAPAFVFFETFEIAREFSRESGLSVQRYGTHLAQVFIHFLRHELLAPAFLARAAVLGIGALERRRGGAASRGATRAASDRLWLFVLGWVLLGCASPLVYERYFVPLSPIVSLLFLLDASDVLERLPRLVEAGRQRAVGGLALASLCAVAAVSLAIRAPEIYDRYYELREPNLGPLDFAVPYVQQRYPRSESLVIATNYEAQSLMYYLDAHVIVGLTGHNVARERSLVPDLVLPRRGWPRGLVEVKRFLARDRYEDERLDVLDVHFNEIPGLSRWSVTPIAHRFRTPVPGPDDGDRQLRIYRRVEGG